MTAAQCVYVLITLSMLGAGVLGQAQTPATVASWRQPYTGTTQACNGSYVAANNIISGVKVHNGSYFVQIPRWREGVPATLLKLNETTGELMAWPDCNSQDEAGAGDPSKLQFVENVEIDPFRGQMWVLDSGRINIWRVLPPALGGCNRTTDPARCPDGGQESSVVPPKLRIYDIVSKSPVGEDFTFPAAVAPRGTAYLNDIVVDLSSDFAYITDHLGVNNDSTAGAIIVYDKRNGRSRRFFGPGSHTSAEIYNFKVDGIAAGQPGTASATGVWGPTPGNAESQPSTSHQP